MQPTHEQPANEEAVTGIHLSSGDRANQYGGCSLAVPGREQQPSQCYLPGRQAAAHPQDGLGDRSTAGGSSPATATTHRLQQGSLETARDEAQGPGHTSQACSFTPTRVWLRDVLEDSVSFHRVRYISLRAPWVLHSTVGQPTTAAVLGQWSSPGHIAEGTQHDATSFRSHCQQEAEEHQEANIVVRSRRRL